MEELLARSAASAKIVPVAVGILGPGLIGSALLRQITTQADKLRDVLKASIKVVGVANSKKMFVDPDGLDEQGWREALETKGQPLDLHRFAELVRDSTALPPAAAPAGPKPCTVLVDCTASEAVPNMYLHWVRMGLHIVAPNKKFGSGPLDRYLSLKPLSLEHGRHFLYEATVGAGLPIMSTLRGLIETGDQVLKVEGILSGTLSYIFNTYKAGMRFSEVVADAKAKGYTEPDPREDLSGLDVARKVVILARECGLPAELAHMEVESLVPGPLRAEGVTPDDYMRELPKFDAEMGLIAAEAEARGEVVRYIGCVDAAQGTCSVKLTSYPRDHPFAQLSGSDNMVVFTTERYKERPLIVRGPGAGAEVTAAGVFQDLVQVVRCHGR